MVYSQKRTEIYAIDIANRMYGAWTKFELTFASFRSKLCPSFWPITTPIMHIVTEFSMLSKSKLKVLEDVNQIRSAIETISMRS